MACKEIFEGAQVVVLVYIWLASTVVIFSFNHPKFILSWGSPIACTFTFKTYQYSHFRSINSPKKLMKLILGVFLAYLNLDLVRVKTPYLSALDFRILDFGVYFKLGKKSSSKPTWFFFEFELDFYCLCSLQKSISKSNWFFSFLNLIFWNWKKFEWHSISQKSCGDSQGVFNY